MRLRYNIDFDPERYRRQALADLVRTQDIVNKTQERIRESKALLQKMPPEQHHPYERRSNDRANG